MKNKICFLFFLFNFSILYADTKSEFYNNRGKFIQEYIDELKEDRKKDPLINGSVVESLSGSFFVKMGKFSQDDIDQQALELCEEKGGEQCKVRFQSLMINPNYNRFASFQILKNIFKYAAVETKASYVREFENIIFLNLDQDISTEPFNCTRSTMDLDFIFDIIQSQISIYPVSFLNKSGLKFVVACDNISLGGTGNPEGAAPGHFDQSYGVFFLSIGKINKQIQNNSANIIKHIFHHEFYHIIDSTLKKIELDYEWKNLNKNSYREGHKANPQAPIKTDGQGFVSDYAMNNEFEDKAELFAYLITKNKEMRKVMAQDKIIFNKVKLMIERMKSLSNDINGSFWSKIY